MRTPALVAAVVASSFFLTGCPDSDSSSPVATKSATFVDTVVRGLQYRCSATGAVKLTDDSGVLTCPVGSTVTFMVGSIVLGDIVMTRNTDIITPAMLAGPGADEGSDEVLNISRFLLALDTDQDPDTGITIDPSSLQNLDSVLDFTVTTASFDTAAQGIVDTLTGDLPEGPFTLPDAGSTEAHIVIGIYLSYAGLYEGTVSREGSTSKVVFLVSRDGRAYGTNETESGLYAAAAGDEEADSLSTQGIFDDFKIDGSTGATYYLSSEAAAGEWTGSVEAGPSFSASRKLAFDALVDDGLVAMFEDMLPLSITLGELGNYVVGMEGITGFPYGQFDGGTPASPSGENDVEYGHINIAEVVSAKDNVVRVIAMSMSGYLLDISMDFSGEGDPAMTAKWAHVHDGVSGTSTTYTANAILEEGIPD